MAITVTDSAGSTISVSVSGGTSTSFTTTSTSVSVSSPTQSSVEVKAQGPKGDGGLDGADGEGLIAGGSENQFIQKNSATDYDTKWSAYTLPAADGAEGTVLTTDGDGTVSFAHPQTIAENVKNVSGGPLDKGTPVHVTGSVGNLAEVIAADAATNYPAHFVLNEDLADDAEGLGIALGFINNVDVPDASIYTEGQTVYLGASGGWTTTKPTGTNAIQNLGIIIKVNTSGNKISGIIMGAGRSNDVPNLPDGKFFIGSSTNTTTSAYTLPTSDGTANQVLATDGSGSVSFTTLAPSDLVSDTSPQLGGNLDVQTFNLFTSSTNGDIQFTPNGTGSINLDGTLKFKRFTSAPTAFEGGMYADSSDNLYFGVS